jgi:hypothetical protein
MPKEYMEKLKITNAYCLQKAATLYDAMIEKCKIEQSTRVSINPLFGASSAAVTAETERG